MGITIFHVQHLFMFRYENDFNILQVAKCSIKVELVNDSYSELRGEIAGPPDTPYQGGNFHLEIKIPETYPFNPPKVSSLLVLTLSPIYGTIFGMLFAVECVGQNNLQIVHYLG